MIRAERLSKSYGGVHALADVTFQIARGEAIAISGANGRARPTLMRILATLIAPSSGRLEIGGVDAIAAPFEARRKLFWAGTPALTSALSVGEYVDLAGARRRRHRLDSTRRASILLRAGLASADVPLSALDAGRRRLVDLAAAALSDAELLLIEDPDETPAALDLHPTAQACAAGTPDRDARLSLVAEARARGATCVVATTDPALTGICDRLLSLEAARAA